MGIREGDIVYAKTCGWSSAAPSGTLVRGTAIDAPWPPGLVLVRVRAQVDTSVWCTKRGSRTFSRKEYAR